MKKRILIIGHARHGKDTLAEMISEQYGYKFKSSSIAASEIFLYEDMKDTYGYNNPNECFEDRINRRAEWKERICDFNTPDKARLAKEILKEADIYVGMRDDEELQECLRQELFDLVIGIYNPNKPEEGRDSFNIDFWNTCDFILPNVGTMQDLVYRVTKLKPLLI